VADERTGQKWTVGAKDRHGQEKNDHEKRTNGNDKQIDIDKQKNMKKKNQTETSRQQNENPWRTNERTMQRQGSG